jgi:exonuclease III
LDALLDIAAAQSEPTLLIGDLNTGRHGIDETGKTFNLPDRFERLSEKWIDAWRHVHGDKREFTWFSRSGNGFRLDHAFVNDSLSARLAGVEYSQVEREEGISDHSVLVVNIRDVLIERAENQKPGPKNQLDPGSAPLPTEGSAPPSPPR